MKKEICFFFLSHILLFRHARHICFYLSIWAIYEIFEKYRDTLHLSLIHFIEVLCHVIFIIIYIIIFTTSLYAFSWHIYAACHFYIFLLYMIYWIFLPFSRVTERLERWASHIFVYLLEKRQETLEIIVCLFLLHDRESLFSLHLYEFIETESFSVSFSELYTDTAHMLTCLEHLKWERAFFTQEFSFLSIYHYIEIYAFSYSHTVIDRDTLPRITHLIRRII